MELRPCLGQGVSQGEEAVLADPGREDETPARVGRMRGLAFLNGLRALLKLSVTWPHIFIPSVKNSFSTLCEWEGESERHRV